MKTIGKLAVQAILTFETEGQDLINTEVFVPTVHTLAMEELVDVEVDVVEQIIKNYIEQQERDELTDNLDQLVKISLCYTSPAAEDTGLRRVLNFLIRNQAKYYFQPNQADFVEKAVMQRMPDVASGTQVFG